MANTTRRTLTASVATALLIAGAAACGGDSGSSNDSDTALKKASDVKQALPDKKAVPKGWSTVPGLPKAEKCTGGDSKCAVAKNGPKAKIVGMAGYTKGSKKHLSQFQVFAFSSKDDSKEALKAIYKSADDDKTAKRTSMEQIGNASRAYKPTKDHGIIVPMRVGTTVALTLVKSDSNGKKEGQSLADMQAKRLSQVQAGEKADAKAS